MAPSFQRAAVSAARYFLATPWKTHKQPLRRTGTVLFVLASGGVLGEINVQKVVPFVQQRYQLCKFPNI